MSPVSYFVVKHKTQHRGFFVVHPRIQPKKQQNRRWHCEIIQSFFLCFASFFALSNLIKETFLALKFRLRLVEFLRFQMLCFLKQWRARRLVEATHKNKSKSKAKDKGEEKAFNVLQWNDQHKFHRLAPLFWDGLALSLPLASAGSVSIQKNIKFLCFIRNIKRRERRKSSVAL